MTKSSTTLMPDFCNRKRRVHLITGLAILQKLGVDVGRVSMVAVGEYENYRGEIQRQSPAPGEPVSSQTEVKLWVGVYTAVDWLPYQFFHGFGSSDRGHSWEDDARHLLAPFDAATLSVRARAVNEGVKYSFASVDEEHLRRFLGLFELELARTKQDLRDALLWAGLMPTFYRWAGNPRIVGRVLSTFLQLPVAIVESVPKQFDIPADLQYSLGDGNRRLGQAAVLGRSFRECDSCYAVKITQVPPDQVDSLLPGGAQRARLERLLATCMPGELDYTIEISAANQSSRLGSGVGDARVGYSLRLTRTEQPRV